ncbi:hypothetical protein V5799_013338 [Amblyomma americanum]|uniref:Serine/threonine-protein kinase greatwall n=1 Tax=Amblyomma americanum TaxID=6943 RepID=A0AAQ4E6A8_AMBAM
MLIMPGGRVKVIDFDTTKVCHGHFSKRILRHYFKRTPFEFNDGESAGTIPYMAPEILKRRPYGRSVDWWSSGIVMYKLMTGRVPFRGKTKQMLRERIITAPLKWPRATDQHGHSATTPAKDMTYRMLRKNPAERLGSRIYSDLKTHPFFDDFDWRKLYNKKQLCAIPSIMELIEEDKKKASGEQDPDDERRHQQIDEMTDILPEMQKPLLCYASKSFRKLMVALKEKGNKNVNADMMNSSGGESSELHYDQQKSATDSIPDLTQCSSEEQECALVDSQTVTADSPADKSTVLPLDVVLYVDGTSVVNESLSKARKLISRTGDTMVLSVMSCSSYRLLTTRRDMFSIMRSVPKEQRADVSVSGKGSVFPGDVVTMVDGTALESLTREQVIQMLSLGKREVSLSIVPLSPMRTRRIAVSRLQEQTLTDANTPSRTTHAAEVN